MSLRERQSFQDGPRSLKPLNNASRRYSKATGYISCHYLSDDYPQVLDVLRNEKPCFVEFEVRAGNVASIRTSAEPVGEGEVNHAFVIGSPV